MIWLTADLHLGHENIIKYCDRPFHGANEMNATLMANIVALVQPTDTLYILGDFAFDPKVYAMCHAALYECCEVIMLKGNHDPKGVRFDWPLALDFKHAKQHFYLCHYPWQTWRPNTVMLHGHSHGNPLALPEDSRQKARYDVGVDTVWEGRMYHPVSIDQVLAKVNCIHKENV